MAAFQFFPSYWEALKVLGNEDIGAIVRAMCEVTFEGIEPEIDGVPSIVFSLVRPNVEYSYERSRSGEAGGRKAGRGRARKGSSETAYQANSEQPMKLNANSLIGERNGTERNGNGNKPTKARFAPPSVSEVSAYMSERNVTSFTAEEFVSYYTGNGWMVGRNRMKDWKATVRSWDSRRMKESNGYRRDGEPASYRPQLFEG